MSDFQNRLESFLLNRNQPLDIEQLTPDASTREYFRVSWNGDTAIACVYPEPFVAADQSYLDVTNVFLAAGLPVAAIYDFDENSGVIVQEDLGDTILREVLENSDDARRNEEGVQRDSLAGMRTNDHAAPPALRRRCGQRSRQARKPLAPWPNGQAC